MASNRPTTASTTWQPTEASGVLRGLLTNLIDRKDGKGNAIAEERPDYRARGIVYKMGAELIDAFPAKKSITAEVGVESLLDQADESPEYCDWKEP